MNKMSVPVTMLGSLILAIVAALASYYGALSSTREAIAEVRTTVAVVQEKQTATAAEVKGLSDSVEYIRRLVEAMSRRQGIDTRALLEVSKAQ